MNDISLDPQIAAVRDDNSEAGVLRAELVRAGLVAVPFRRTAVSLGTGASLSQAFPANGDGTQTGIFVNVPHNAALNAGSSIGFWVWGTTVGIRMDRFTASWSGNPVGCLIDGIAYPVDNSKLLNPTLQAQTTVSTSLAGQILATDLPNGPHYVELVFPVSATVDRLWGILGFIADAAAGYEAYPRGVNATTAPVAVTTGFVALFGPTTPFTGIRKLFFLNTTGAAITVSVRWTTNGAMWSRPVPANDTIEFDPGGPLYDNLSVSASATGVNCTIVGVA